MSTYSWGECFHFCFSFVAVKNRAEFSASVDRKHGERGQLWRQGCCEIEDNWFIGAGTQIQSGSINPRECAGRTRNRSPEPLVKRAS